MKHFRNLGIIAIMLFSFFYTERIADLTLKNNEMYKTIESNSKDYQVLSVNATIDSESITPGLNGKEVDIKSSYYNMKDLNIFNSYYLVYNPIYPNVSINNNMDKIITKGNSLKNSVAFILEYDDKLINYFKNKGYDASILVNAESFNKNEILEQINNDYKNFVALESLLDRYNKNSNICYITQNNEEECRNNKKYLVKTNKLLNNSTILDIKNNISSGDIYYVSKNTDEKNIQLIINNIMYKDLDIVRLSKLISEERD